jgi:hypothetical protein
MALNANKLAGSSGWPMNVCSLHHQLMSVCNGMMGKRNLRFCAHSWQSEDTMLKA